MQKNNLYSNEEVSITLNIKSGSSENSLTKTKALPLISQNEKNQREELHNLLKSEEVSFFTMLEQICLNRINKKLLTANGEIKDYKRWTKFKHNPDSFIKTELGKLIVSESKIKKDIKCKYIKKIKADPNYKIDKSFAVMIGLALKLDNYEMKYFLAKAGLTLYKGIPWDKIIIEHIEKGEFDPITINSELDKYRYELFNVN